MARSKHDPLDRLLKCGINELSASILAMSAKECERYTRAMLDRIGGPSFEQLLMRIVETMVPTDGGNHQVAQMNIISRFGAYFPMCPQKATLSVKSWLSRCEWPCCAWKRRSYVLPFTEQEALGLSVRLITRLLA